MFGAAGSDDQVTLWDLAVERDNEAEGKGRHLDVPPQLLFIHMVRYETYQHENVCFIGITNNPTTGIKKLCSGSFWHGEPGRI